MDTRITRVLATLLVLITFTVGAAAEERVLELGKWYKTAETGLNLTQSTYSDNWNGGDKGAIVWTWNFNGTLENQLSDNVNWLNTLKLAYGQTHQQGFGTEGDRVVVSPAKSTDLVDLESLFRFTLGAVVDPYASGRFESQFQDGSDPLGRTLALNPMQLQAAAGIAKQFINEEERSLMSRLGFSFHQNRRSFFTDGLDPAVEDTDTWSSNDGGIEFVTDYKTRVLDDKVAWTSKLGVYQPLFYSGKSDLEDADLEAAGLDADLAAFTTAADIDWENIFTASITEHISVNLYLRWVYDKYDNSVAPTIDGAIDAETAAALSGAVRKVGQLKQTLSLGFNYRLF